MSSVDLKFNVPADSEGVLGGENTALTPGKCLLCQKVQPKSAKSIYSEGQEDNKFFWVCCECRQIDSTDLLLGSDLKLGNIYDILGDSKGVANRYKSDIDAQSAQLMWVELRHTVRCIYRKAGTELAIDHMLDVDKMKSLVHKLCERGPQQLYHQLETQGREYVEEVKFHLLEHLLCHPSSIGIPQHAREFAQTLLDEYEQLLCATVTLQSFLSELEDEHMAKFGITWMLVNQHLFHQVVYSDPIIQKSLPGVCIQLKYGELQQTPNTNSKFESYTSVYYRLKSFEEEMVLVEQTWIRAIVSLASFVNEKTSNKDKVYEEWEFLGRQHLLYARENAMKKAKEETEECGEDKPDNIPSSLLGHKKLFIKHSIPAPPIYPKAQLKAATEVLKNVKVDQLSSGSIEIKADDSSCVCDCSACTTLMDSLVSNSPTDDEASPLEQNWVQIPDDIKDTGCDSSTQTLDETEDRHSERRLSTSSVSSKESDNHKPKYCACCYCELVGHPNPSAHNSHNYELFREKLRKKLEFKRNPEKAKRELCAEHQNNFNLVNNSSTNTLLKPANQPVVDNRSVEELVSFIEGPKDGKEPKRRKRKSKAKDQSRNEESKLDQNTEQSGEVNCKDPDAKEEDTPPAKSAKQKESETRKPDSSQPKNNVNNSKANSDKAKADKNNANKKKNIEDANLKDFDPTKKDCVFRKMFDQKRVEMENFSFHLEKFKNLTQEQKIELLCGRRISDPRLYQKQQDLLKSINLPKELASKVKEAELQEKEAREKSAKDKKEKKETPVPTKKEGKQKLKEQQQQPPQAKKAEKTSPKPPENANHVNVNNKSEAPVQKAKLAKTLPAEPKPEVVMCEAKKEPAPDMKSTQNGAQAAAKKKYKKKKKRNESLDDIFLPKCEADEMDYLDDNERELENFKRFCMDTQPLKTRQKIQLNWKNISVNSRRPI